MKVFISEDVQEYYQNTSDDGTWIDVKMNELEIVLNIASRSNKEVLIKTDEL